MAGKPGRSGGYRPGAGRKPNPPDEPLPAVNGQAPLDFLLAVQNDPLASPALRVRAAIAAAQYLHTKTHDGGKKDAQAEKAKKANAGKFAPAAAPLKLVSS